MQIYDKGVKIYSVKGEQETHSFKDIIKILPIYENQEIHFENVNKQIVKTFKCPELQQIISVYIRAIDDFIQDSRDLSFSQIIQGFSKYELDWRILNCSEKSVYKITMKIYRSHLKIYLISKKIYKKDVNIIHGIDSKHKESGNSCISIYFHDIQSIINTFFGFIISIKNSH